MHDASKSELAERMCVPKVATTTNTLRWLYDISIKNQNKLYNLYHNANNLYIDTSKYLKSSIFYSTYI